MLTKCDRSVRILSGQARLALGGILCALVAGAGLAALRAQPAERVNGRTALGLVLRQINNTGTFMMATAHPDDENNGVLALLSKGEGIRTTLVTATRGDGGQNGLKDVAKRLNVSAFARLRVGVGPADETGVNLAIPVDIVGKFAATGQEPPVFHAPERLADQFVHIWNTPATTYRKGGQG